MNTTGRMTAADSVPRHQRGSSILVVLVLLACMVLLISANTSTLHTLQRELKLIDAQQQKKYTSAARP